MVEFFFIFSVSLLLCIFVFYSHKLVSGGSLLSLQMTSLSVYLLGLIFLLYYNTYGLSFLEINNFLERGPLAHVFALLVCLGAISFFFFSEGYLAKNSLHEAELLLVVLLGLGGIIFVIFGSDFLTIYLGIELQSLSLIILATLKTNSTYSTEAGLKYLVLGAFSSSILILGMAIFYGTTGLYSFSDMEALYLFGDITSDARVSAGLSISLVLIISSLLFKMGAAPFHFWVPDVYEGAPTVITAFFSAIPKLSIFSLFIRLILDILQVHLVDLSLLLHCSGLLSIAIGSIGALGQQNLKRIFSYSAIAHAGFLIFGLSLGTLHGLAAVIFYSIIYLSLTLNLFCSILGLNQKTNGSPLKVVSSLGFAYKSQFWVTVSFCFCLFGIAGVPPLSGFFSKLFILVAGLESNFLMLSLIIVLLSVVSSVYYLRVIRSLVFVKNKKEWLLFEEVPTGHAYVISGLFFFNFFFFLFGLEIYYFALSVAGSFYLI